MPLLLVVILVAVAFPCVPRFLWWGLKTTLWFCLGLYLLGVVLQFFGFLAR
jgi:hypothetical protein